MPVTYISELLIKNRADGTSFVDKDVLMLNDREREVSSVSILGDEREGNINALG